MRVIRTLTRRDDLLDFLTPLPTLAPGETLDEIRWEGGSNFDVMNPLFGTTAPGHDFTDPNVTQAERASLTPVSMAGHHRVTIKPSSYSLVGTFWLRRVVRISASDFTGESLHMMSPRVFTARQIHTIDGTAPTGATVANSLRLELPRTCTSFVISVNTGSNPLAIAFNERGGERIVAAGTTVNVFAGTASTLYIRGSGGNSLFQVVASEANNLLSEGEKSTHHATSHPLPITTEQDRH